MKQQGGGSIVGVSSVQGKIAIPYRSACKWESIIGPLHKKSYDY